MHIVYVLSSDFAPQLHLSLRSLFMSGTTVDCVTVFSVGGDLSWDTGHLPITFRIVDNLSESYWMINKTYLSEVDGKEVVFLDTDTIIQHPIDAVLEPEADVIARRATVCTLSTWEESAWRRYLAEREVERMIPVLNAGFLVFRGGIHQRIGAEWKEYIGEAWEQRLFGNGYHADQWALPVALGRNGATCSLLDAKGHAFAWEGDDPNGAVVYHTGASNFFGHVRTLENNTFIQADLPIPRPSVVWHYTKDRLKKKLEGWSGIKSKIVK